MAPSSLSGDDQAAQRAHLITGLVSQLKRGDITKTQLFSRLSGLQAGAMGGGEMGDDARSMVDAGSARLPEHSQEDLPMPPPRPASAGAVINSQEPRARVTINGLLTSDDRRAIIQRLIAEKRRRAAAAAAMAASASASPQLRPPLPPGQPSHPSARVQSSQAAEGHANDGPAGLDPWGDGSPWGAENGEHEEGGLGEDGGTDGNGRRGQQHQPPRRRRGGSDGDRDPIGGVNGDNRGRGGSHGSGHDHNGYDNGYSGEPIDKDAYKLRSFSEERARRSEELVRRELMQECVFRPRIKELPASYGALKNADTPFLQRVGQWQADKERGAARRVSVGRDAELEGCTFAPAINANSRRAAAWRLEDEGAAGMPVDERLFDESRRRREERERLERDTKAREEEELERSCTFRPSLATSAASGAPAAASRFKALANLRDSNHNGCNDGAYRGFNGPKGWEDNGGECSGNNASGNTTNGCGGNTNGDFRGNNNPDSGFHFRVRPRPAPAGPEECTFKPAVLGPRGDMPSARLYLQLDVVDRLTGAFLKDDGRGGAAGSSAALGATSGSTPATASGYDHLEYLSGLGDEEQYENGNGNISNGKGGQGSTASVAGGVKESFLDRPSFREFLARQNHSIVRRQRQIESLSARSAPPFRPELCPGSRKLQSASGATGDFLQRLARDAVRKEHAGVKAEARRRTQRPSFRPELTPRSRSMPARTPVEMSRGDQLRRETAQRLAKLRAEQERLTGMTFRPALSGGAAAANARGRLRVLSEPGLYVRRVQEMRQRRDEAVRRRAAEKEAQEAEGCTFRPEMTSCPAYIKRIARGAAAARAAAAPVAAEAPSRPDWR